MILIRCAECAKTLSDTPGVAKRCGQCKTRYCNAACQRDHWRRGHKAVCVEVHSSGNAEQYNADKKYKKAVAVAVEECAEDTKGQTCYIRMEERNEAEGLVRMCACRGSAGFAHVSCLARQAEVSVAGAVDDNDIAGRFEAWYTCRLCETHFYGLMCGALGWACWKTYLSRPDGPDRLRFFAISQLGNGLGLTDKELEAIDINHSCLRMIERSEESETKDKLICLTYSNLSNCYRALGRLGESLVIDRKVYELEISRWGGEHESARTSAMNYARTLGACGDFAGSAEFIRGCLPLVTKGLAPDHADVIHIRLHLANGLWLNRTASEDDVREAVTILEDLHPKASRVLGEAHPDFKCLDAALTDSRTKLAKFQGARSTYVHYTSSAHPGDATVKPSRDSARARGHEK